MQVTVEVDNKPGALLSVCEALGSNNIDAISCTEAGHTAIHLVVSDADAAEEALRAVGSVTLKEIVAFQMANEPGAVASIAKACSDAGVNIHTIYATTAGEGGAMVYVDVDDLPKAQEVCGDI